MERRNKGSSEKKRFFHFEVWHGYRSQTPSLYVLQKILLHALQILCLAQFIIFWSRSANHPCTVKALFAAEEFWRTGLKLELKEAPFRSSRLIYPFPGEMKSKLKQGKPPKSNFSEHEYMACLLVIFPILCPKISSILQQLSIGRTSVSVLSKRLTDDSLRSAFCQQSSAFSLGTVACTNAISAENQTPALPVGLGQ